jgi:hypothetical protein
MLPAVLALLSCLAWSPAKAPTTTGAVEVVARVENSGREVATVLAVADVPSLLLATGLLAASTGGGSGSPATTPEQVLSTTVQDPNHPGEPWVVTTYRRADESFEAFIRRHRDMVDAVRKALNG